MRGEEEASAPGVSIVHLGERPDHLATVAGWLHGEWGHLPGASLEKRVRELEGQLRRGAVPCALVALDGSSPVGAASLVASDMRSHPEWSPWLAAVYVAPDARGRGIGSALSLRVAEEAAALGFRRLYLFTPTQQRLYARLGWREIGRELYNTREVTVMVLELGDGRG